MEKAGVVAGVEAQGESAVARVEWRNNGEGRVTIGLLSGAGISCRYWSAVGPLLVARTLDRWDVVLVKVRKVWAGDRTIGGWDRLVLGRAVSWQTAGVALASGLLAASPWGQCCKAEEAARPLVSLALSRWGSLLSRWGRLLLQLVEGRLVLGAARPLLNLALSRWGSLLLHLVGGCLALSLGNACCLASGMPAA